MDSVPKSAIGSFYRLLQNTTRFIPWSSLRGINLVVFCVCAGGMTTAGSLAGCGERTPPPNARDVLNKNEQSISEALDKFQVEQDERDKPAGAGNPAAADNAAAPKPPQSTPAGTAPVAAPEPLPVPAAAPTGPAGTPPTVTPPAGTPPAGTPPAGPRK